MVVFLIYCNHNPPSSANLVPTILSQVETQETLAFSQLVTSNRHTPESDAKVSIVDKYPLLRRFFGSWKTHTKTVDGSFEIRRTNHHLDV